MIADRRLMIFKMAPKGARLDFTHQSSISTHQSMPSLIVADSERSADMLYATRFFAPDAFIFLDAGGCRSVVLSDLEIDRGRRDARVDEVIAFSDVKSR